MAILQWMLDYFSVMAYPTAFFFNIAMEMFKDLSVAATVSFFLSTYILAIFYLVLFGGRTPLSALAESRYYLFGIFLIALIGGVMPFYVSLAGTTPVKDVEGLKTAFIFASVFDHLFTMFTFSSFFGTVSIIREGVS